MNRARRNVLGLLWGCGMDGTDPAREMSKFLEGGEMRELLDSLRQDGMLSGMRVTDMGRAEITVIMCGGVFDIIHHGHVHTLNAAKALGDVLVVVVASDSMAKTKKVHHDAPTRRRIVDALGVVDVCLVGHDSDMFETVKVVRPDIIALGYDQAHQTTNIEAGCRRIGLSPRVVRLESPVPDVASSELKRNVSLDSL